MEMIIKVLRIIYDIKSKVLTATSSVSVSTYARQLVQSMYLPIHIVTCYVAVTFHCWVALFDESQKPDLLCSQ